MEGPSLVIACEELKPYLKQKIRRATGTATLPWAQLKGHALTRLRSWGKHLILSFGDLHLRIHFLMFGSYRIDDPRENRVPKLRLDYGDHQIYFYSCAIKILPQNFMREYDWSVDLMSPKWDAGQALGKLRAHLDREVCDVLMDQAIFSGLGNIMKNEILFNLKMHPQTRIREISSARQRKLVREAESYAWQFYRWKKAKVLKRHWQIMRKPACPDCGGKVSKKVTGKGERLSHFCRRCQLRA